MRVELLHPADAPVREHGFYVCRNSEREPGVLDVLRGPYLRAEFAEAAIRRLGRLILPELRR